MNEDKTYFFRPRVGENYHSGFNGLKTLVLGAYHFCWKSHADRYNCAYYEQCVREGHSKDYDELCPIYKDRMDQYNGYYRISNSNIIEIDSYTEGERCPSYGEFTRFLTGIYGRRISEAERLAFWNSVVFYNYIQHFLPEAEDFTYQERKPVLDADFPAFTQVIEELRPDVIYIWTDAIKEAVESNLEKLNGVSLKFCKREYAGSLTIWTAVASYAGDQKHIDAEVVLNEFALATKRDKMSAAKAILEFIGLCRDRKVSQAALNSIIEDMPDAEKSRLHSLKYDDDFVSELTDIYQSLSGLKNMFNSQQENIHKLVGGGRLYSNFYVPGACPVFGTGPEHLSLWGLSRGVSIDRLSGAMMQDDVFLMWADEGFCNPGALVKILENVRHDGIRHLLLLMKASQSNDSFYFSPIKKSCLADSIYEADDSILINMTPDYREKIVMYPGGERSYRRFTQLIPSNYWHNKKGKQWFETFLIKNRIICELNPLREIAVLLYNAQDDNVLFVEQSADGTDRIRCIDEKSEKTAMLFHDIKEKSRSAKFGKYMLQYKDIQKLLNIGGNIGTIAKRISDLNRKPRRQRRRQK